MGSSATEGVGFSRGAQFMLLEQATREALPGKPLQAGDVRLLTPTGREVFARYLAGGRMAFAVDRAVDIRQVLEFAARHGVKPVIVGGAQASQVATLLARSKVPVVLEPLLALPGTFDQLGASMENAAQLHRAGVPVMFTHFSAGTNQSHKVRQGAGVAVAHGLPWDAALAALTSTPADVFGLGAAAGRIMPGSPADLVLWSGDPLEVTTVAEQVWIGGKAQAMRSRQTELRDRLRPTGAAARPRGPRRGHAAGSPMRYLVSASLNLVGIIQCAQHLLNPQRLEGFRMVALQTHHLGGAEQSLVINGVGHSHTL